MSRCYASHTASRAHVLRVSTDPVHLGATPRGSIFGTHFCFTQPPNELKAQTSNRIMTNTESGVLNLQKHPCLLHRQIHAVGQNQVPLRTQFLLHFGCSQLPMGMHFLCIYRFPDLSYTLLNILPLYRNKISLIYFLCISLSNMFLTQISLSCLWDCVLHWIHPGGLSGFHRRAGPSKVPSTK